MNKNANKLVHGWGNLSEETAIKMVNSYERICGDFKKAKNCALFTCDLSKKFCGSDSDIKWWDFVKEEINKIHLKDERYFT